jgi:hypothetical protein
MKSTGLINRMILIFKKETLKTMNIEIKFEGTTGAEARQELMALLGIDLSITISGKDLQYVLERKETPAEEIKTVEEIKTEETVKGKRRTKAEIAADEAAKAQETPAQETPAQETPAQETPAQETPATTFPELVDLQRACAIIVRAGYKQKGIDIIKNTGKAATSKDVAPELRQACIDELNAFADENQIAR